MGEDQGDSDDGDEVRCRATEVAVAASRGLPALVARALGEVRGRTTVPQLRVLLLLGARGPLDVSTIAHHLEVNPSNVSRTCDQLVTAGRVARGPHPADRRRTVLLLTASGTAFLAELEQARRRVVAEAVSRMPAEDQRALAQGLEAFLRASEVSGEGGSGAPEWRVVPWPR
ncbi:MarR family winged helix-turn-helix transcriptional regulator [Nocardioides aurantiacus]|uniref:MarR family winged helix-turn-helix transcriptional regulator n=1 Tax=Nocardioides aurantiacus TaxID=86796 RepID=UPI00403EF9B4